MAKRNEARAKQAQDDLRQFVGFSAADEIEKLDRLKSAGSISEQEYTRLRTRLVQWIPMATARTLQEPFKQDFQCSIKLTKAEITNIWRGAQLPKLQPTREVWFS